MLLYSTVRDYVRIRRVQVFVPQEHAPGAEAEGEVCAMLNGVKMKCNMFARQLSHSGKVVYRGLFLL